MKICLCAKHKVLGSILVAKSEKAIWTSGSVTGEQRLHPGRHVRDVEAAGDSMQIPVMKLWPCVTPTWPCLTRHALAVGNDLSGLPEMGIPSRKFVFQITEGQHRALVEMTFWRSSIHAPAMQKMVRDEILITPSCDSQPPLGSLLGDAVLQEGTMLRPPSQYSCVPFTIGLSYSWVA